MWTFFYDKAGTKTVRCCISGLDVYESIIDMVPRCKDIRDLATIDVTRVVAELPDEETKVSFVITKNISDFIQKPSLLKNILYMAASTESLDEVPAIWDVSIYPQKEQDKYPLVREVRFVVEELTIKDRPTTDDGIPSQHKILWEVHVLTETGFAYWLPRFVMLDIHSKMLKFAEVVYQYQEDDESKMLTITGIVSDHISNIHTTFTVLKPMILD